ncbi:MAG: DUF6088 family protein [Chitinophagales bacterium]
MTTSNIQNQINSFPENKLFSYSDFQISPQKKMALAKRLSILSKKRIIKRYKKGIYYKPKKTIFGFVKPSEKEQLDLLLKNENRTELKAYISYETIYYTYGLTTQVSNIFVIVSNKPKKSTQIGGIKVKYVKGICPTCEKDVKLLQLLDIIKSFKKIPARNDEIFVAVVKRELNLFSAEELARFIFLAKKYNPATKALLGAILELSNQKQVANLLKSTLNPLTKFQLSITKKALPNQQNWQIF